MADMDLIAQAESMMSSERDLIANTANVSSIVSHALADRHNGKTYNWTGFYFMRKGELVLGPFMGKPACIRIKVGRGVCGTAVSEKKSQLIQDVHEFKGHIACDSASNSELVVPLFDPNDPSRVVGVFDLDCEQTSGFDANDQLTMEAIARAVEKACDWSCLEK